VTSSFECFINRLYVDGFLDNYGVCIKKKNISETIKNRVLMKVTDECKKQQNRQKRRFI